MPVEDEHQDVCHLNNAASKQTLAARKHEPRTAHGVVAEDGRVAKDVILVAPLPTSAEKLHKSHCRTEPPKLHQVATKLDEEQGLRLLTPVGRGPTR